MSNKLQLAFLLLHKIYILFGEIQSKKYVEIKLINYVKNF